MSRLTFTSLFILTSFPCHLAFVPSSIAPKTRAKPDTFIASQNFIKHDGSLNTIKQKYTGNFIHSKHFHSFLERRTQLNMALIGNLSFEDLIYNAESMASDMATYSIGAAEAGTSSISALLILYFAGLLTSFSPCSLSLLPLTVSYISTAAGERSDKAAFFPTVAFASGLAFVFCGLGLSVSFLGGVFGQSAAASDNLLASFALVALSAGVSIAMGLQLLEVIRIPLPSVNVDLPFLKAETATSSGSSSSELLFDDDGNIMQPPPTEESDSSISSNSLALVRVFLLGGSCALLESPCATPVLTSILAFVGVSRNPLLGATLLLTYTVGYSTPLLVVGATGGEALAKLQASSCDDCEGEDGKSSSSNSSMSWATRIGEFVSPFTGAVLIWYGTNSLLTGLFGDASLSGLSPVL